MRNPDLRLMPDSVNVAAKVIDGEAVILDVTRGTYYSMDGAGAVVWAAIEQGHSLGTIVRILGERYDGTAGVRRGPGAVHRTSAQQIHRHGRSPRARSTDAGAGQLRS
jgi:hypothetical protein